MAKQTTGSAETNENKAIQISITITAELAREELAASKNTKSGTHKTPVIHNTQPNPKDGFQTNITNCTDTESFIYHHTNSLM